MFEELLSEMTTIELVLQLTKIVLMIGAGGYALFLLRNTNKLLNNINKLLNNLTGEE